MSVGWYGSGRTDCDRAGSAGVVEHDGLMSPEPGQVLSYEAATHVWTRARTDSHNDLHRSAGKALSACTSAAERQRRAADPCDERTPGHSMTSSARARSECGTVRPRALAVVRLITSSILVGCSTGSSPGFVPRKILST